MSLLAPPLCWHCGAPAPPPEPLCRACRSGLRWLPPEPVELAGVRVWAPVAYEGASRALVRGLKFRGALRLAEAMAAAVAARMPEELLGRALVPVPLAPRRRAGRGFNQAELLARALAPRLGLPVAPVLSRRGTAAPQVGRGRLERLARQPGSFELRQDAAAPARALLVDDVVTTGATLAACAAALRAAGSTDVGAVAYARTPGR